MRPASGIFIQHVVCEGDGQCIGPTRRLRGSFVNSNSVRGSHENILVCSRRNCGRSGPHEPIPGFTILRGCERVPKVLDLAQSRLDGLEDCRFQRRVVANEFIDSRPDKNSVFFVLKNTLVSLRGEYRKQARNDGGSRSELVLAGLVET